MILQDSGSGVDAVRAPVVIEFRDRNPSIGVGDEIPRVAFQGLPILGERDPGLGGGGGVLPRLQLVDGLLDHLGMGDDVVVNRGCPGPPRFCCSR